jgi:molybdopterin molybdotransferase
MPEFLYLRSPKEALSVWLDHLTLHPKSEEIETAQALGRITFQSVFARHPLPSFDRSTVDGYAVRAGDTYGASDGLPAFLVVNGEVLMGVEPDYALQSGQTVLIHTGGMLPRGADAVVMLEHTQKVGDQDIEVLRAVAVWDNVIRTGEDVAKGDIVIPAGVRLRPAEIGGLMAFGITQVEVARKPRAGILSSGDEVIPPEKEIRSGQVRDINSYTLSAMIEEFGGIPVRYGIAPDRKEVLFEMASRALRECDLLVITAGSSASSRDMTSEVIDMLGPPGVLVHGVNVRPGKPTILAACAPEEHSHLKAVIGLPGNPVSALVIARLFLKPVIEALLGIQRPVVQAVVQAELMVNLPSQAGREDWVPVRMISKDGRYQAEPIFGKSNLIFTLVRAEGLIHIPTDATGLGMGETVEVFLL